MKLICLWMRVHLCVHLKYLQIFRKEDHGKTTASGYEESMFLGHDATTNTDHYAWTNIDRSKDPGCTLGASSPAIYSSLLKKKTWFTLP